MSSTSRELALRGATALVDNRHHFAKVASAEFGKGLATVGGAYLAAAFLPGGIVFYLILIMLVQSFLRGRKA